MIIGSYMSQITVSEWAASDYWFCV